MQTQKNAGMPSRHITPQSFDEILSDLGDDPAIPDPHGIRKSTAPKAANPQAQNHTEGPQPFESLSWSAAFGQLQKLGVFISIGACLIGLCLALFFTLDSAKSRSEALAQNSQDQISALQKELALVREEFQNNLDDLYEEIDLLEVSIHSLKHSKPFSQKISKPASTPNESELKAWRFLGTAQIRGSHQAFFHTGKRHVVFEKGALVLGDWRLTQIEKELVALTHPSGKTLLLKPSKPD
jgi:hypothetical protein